MSKKIRRKRRATVAKLRKSTASLVRRNPPVPQDFLHTLLPGFGAYATTRLISRVAWMLTYKRFPRVAKHISSASTILAFVSVWLLGHRIKRLERYHEPLIVGSGVAALQTIARTYVPRYGWIVSDIRPEDARLPAKRAQVDIPPIIHRMPQDEYSMFEEQAAVEMGASSSSMATGPTMVPEQNPEAISDDDFADMFEDSQF